jgi:hypothetical protein
VGHTRGQLGRFGTAEGFFVSEIDGHQGTMRALRLPEHPRGCVVPSAGVEGLGSSRSRCRACSPRRFSSGSQGAAFRRAELARGLGGPSVVFMGSGRELRAEADDCVSSLASISDLEFEVLALHERRGNAPRPD